MALEIGNLLGAVANAQTALGKSKSVKQFIKNFDEFGFQTDNNFEVNFSGISKATFFVQTINFGQVKQNFTQVYYNGRAVDIPMNPEYDHEGQMSVLADGNGYIYSAFTNFLISDTLNQSANSGYTMTIKCLTGDKDYKGLIITLRGVRITTVDGLSFDYAGQNAQKFNVGFKYIDFAASPGAFKKASGLLGAASQLLG